MNLASKIDHTLLKADASKEDITKLCDEAKQYGFASVCIPPYWVRECKNQLRDSKVKIATVVAFPMGYSATPAKVEECRRAIDEGATEIDMVLNIIALKAGDYNYLKNELTSAGTIVQLRGGKLKVILETGLLTKEEIIEALFSRNYSELDDSTIYYQIHGVKKFLKKLGLSNPKLEKSGPYYEFKGEVQLLEEHL
jgi:deoxyribose-phosphate aldolase